MDPKLVSPLKEYLLAVADDELILGHRDSEWCGQAPIIEEDIAFANIALDEIGHASAWYELLAFLDGDDTDAVPDRLVFFRSPQDYRNVRMVELPNGDWAFSMLRQYLFDAMEKIRLPELAKSRFAPLAAAAGKILREEIYHHRHTRAWVQRLGLGTEESHRRLQNALAQLWPAAHQLFTPVEGEDPLVRAGYIPSSAALQAEWEALVIPFLRECDLVLPENQGDAAGREQHTLYLKLLLDEMQSVARLEPEAEW